MINVSVSCDEEEPWKKIRGPHLVHEGWEMAVIDKRRAADGALTYLVRIRHRGQPIIRSATFLRLAEARKWARQQEALVHKVVSGNWHHLLDDVRVELITLLKVEP